jgi:hypothetical protein
MSNIKRRFNHRNTLHSPLDFILKSYKIEKKHGKKFSLKNSSKKSLSSNIAFYIIDNFTKITDFINKKNGKHVCAKTNRKHDIVLQKENIIALEYTQNITSAHSKSQVDFFSFRLKDLSLNYHLNSISPNLLRTSFDKDNKTILNDTQLTQSPNFLQNDKTMNYLENQFTHQNEKTFDQVDNRINQNVFSENLDNNIKNSASEGIKKTYFNLGSSGFKRTKTIESYKIIQESNQTHHSKSANDILLKDPKTERKYSNECNENGESMLNDNNSVSNGSEIDMLKREFAENSGNLNKGGDVNSNMNNISVSNLEAEKTCSEVSSTNNFSIQESGSSNISQERFKKIRGFNFKNNVNTKKFSRQNVGKNSSVDKNIVVDINIPNNTNLSSIPISQVLFSDIKKPNSEESSKDKGLKVKRFNFNNNINNINLKKYKSPSPNNENKDKI